MFRITLIAVLALSISWKIALATRSVKIDQVDFVTATERFLARQGYAVEDNEVIDGVQIVRASAQSCRFIVAKLDPLVWQADMVRDFAPDDRKVFFVFRGAIYKQPPSLQSTAEHYLSRFLRELGLSKSDPLMIAVVAPQNCDADQIPWRRFSLSEADSV